jgi:ABC-2 type transport system permease protein
MLYNALVANSRKVIIEMQRYLPNTLSLVATFYIIFLAMFFGIRIIGDPATAEANIQFVIVSNAFWFLAIMAMTSMGWEVTTEATRGTLEQLAMSPVGLPAILLLRMIANIAAQLVIIAAMLVLVMWTAGQWLNFDLTLLPILVPTLISMIGIGYVVAGLSIIFKQIQALLQILQFVFLGMTFVPLSALPWLELAPFVKGVDLTRQVMTQGLGLGDLGFLDWLSLIANAALYFTLGLVFFRWCEQVARRQGLLGQY